MKIKILIISVFLTSLLWQKHTEASTFEPPSTYVQSDTIVPINTIVERSQLYFENFPLEKVHLQFDKPYYSVGDTAWFSVFLSSNLFNYRPSTSVYVEILNSRDSLIQTYKIPLELLAGKGQIVFNQSVYTRDNYRIRAYSKWMGNFDPDYFYNRMIPVGDVLNNHLSSNISYTADSKSPDTKTLAKIQFSDRHGNLLPNRKVNWEIISNYETVSKGKGDTDASGNFNLELLAAKEASKYQNAVIHISLDEGKGNNPLASQIPLYGAFFDADVQFFPEGGQLIAAVNKKVGFKAIGSNGLGLKVKGLIKDATGNVITEISDLNAGMGYFNLFPTFGMQYMAEITFQNGVTKTFALPEVVEQGLTLIHHKTDENNLQMAVLTNPDFLNKHLDEIFYVFAQSQSTLCFAAQVSLKNESLLVNIPKERLPSGIVQVLITDQFGKPISERMIFSNMAPFLKIQAKTDKTTYLAKDLVEIALDVQHADTTFQGTFSVSVTDVNRVPADLNADQSIWTSFLLNSELKGYLENPNYYFNDANENRLEALDALLLTQGYKRFQISDFTYQKYPEILFYPEQGIEISGILRNNIGRAIPNAGLLLSIPDRSYRTDLYTDEKGLFHFEDLVFTDSSRVTINARGNDDYRNLVIHIDPTNLPGLDKNPDWPSSQINLESTLQPYLKNSRQVYRTDVMLEAVEVLGSKVVKRSSKDFSALSGLGMAEHEISPDRLKGCRLLLQCLPTVLTGITYDSQLQKFYISRDYQSGGRIPAQVFLNGMPVDAFSLNSVLVEDIEGIEIFLKDELGTVSRTYQNNGVISIITKKEEKAAPRMSLAEIERLLPKSNIVDLTPLGYIKEYTFYKPKYDTPEKKNVRDIRSTIYWNPSVKTDEQGKASFQFYNGDGNGEYRVIIEGVDVTGNYGRQVIHYTVRP